MALNEATLDYFPSIDYVFNIPLSNFITFEANNCGCTGINQNLMINWIHPMFLNSKAAKSKE